MNLIKADYIVIGAFLLLIVAHSTTNFLTRYYGDVAEEIKETRDVVNAMEANPIVRWSFQFNHLRWIYQFFVMPIWFFGMYYYIRRKFEVINPVIIETMAMMAFMMALLDASNDVSIMLGLLMK